MRSLMVVASCVVLGFATACANYATHQAAFVPHATPVPGDGQPLDTPAQIGVGASSIDLTQPSASDPNAGDAVPKVQMRGSLDGQFGRYMTFGASLEHGEVAEPVTPYQPALGNSGATGYGLHVQGSIPTGLRGLRIALSAEAVAWSVPYIQYDTCVQNCGAGNNGYTVSYQGNDNVTTWAFGLVPSYRTGAWTVYGGATLRDQPTTAAKFDTTSPGDAGVDAGPTNLTVHAGVEYDVRVIKLAVAIHDTVTSAPITYGPSIAAMVSIPLGKRLPWAY
jgi:hypothetical protein